MAIVTTTHTLPARAGRPAETVTTITGEVDYVRPKRLETPPAPQQPVLTLDEVRDLLAVQTEQLTDMDSEIKLITERAAEVRTKLSNNGRALVSALAQNKVLLADYARAKVDDKAVSQGKANVRDLEDLIAGLKDVTVVIASELAALQEPREYQKRLTNRYHDLAWDLAADIEREKALPFLQREFFARMQRNSGCGTGRGETYPEALGVTITPELLKEHNLPPRY